MRTLTVLALLGCLLVGVAEADLSAVTGEDYDWVAYNNLTATLSSLPEDKDPPPPPPANVTGFTVDNDMTAAQVPSGELLAFDDGSGTGVTLTVSEIDPGGDYLWCDNTTPQNAGLIFSDALGTSYAGNAILHDPGSTQLLTLTGLDPALTYTFAGVAAAPSGYHNSLSTVVIQGVDAFVNESVLTGTSLVGRTGRGEDYIPITPTTGPDRMDISFVDDDLAMWTGINPGADGSFSVLVTSVYIGHREWAPGLDAIALGASGGGEGDASPLPGDMDGDGDVDADDVDLLRAAVGDPTEDLDGDGDVDEDDFAYLVRNYLQWHRSNPGDGVGTEIGDITLDGLVGEADRLRMVDGFGFAGGWGDGNLNVDTLVDGSDLALLMANFGADMEEHAPVPEPATLMVLAVGTAGLLRRRR